MLNGIYQPDAGEYLVDGKAVKLASPRQAFDTGIAMVFQEQSILPSLTVAENIFLGREEEFLRYRTDLQGAHERGRGARAEEGPSQHPSRHALLPISPSPTARWSRSPRRCRSTAASSGDVTILLDEPTSVLEQKEVELLFEIIADLKQRASIVFISHRLDEVLADLRPHLRHARRQGGEGDSPAKARRSRTLHQHMVGRQLHHEYYREARQAVPRRRCLKRAASARTGAFQDVELRAA